MAEQGVSTKVFAPDGKQFEGESGFNLLVLRPYSG